MGSESPALRSVDVPLHKLTRDQLSAFLHVAFLPDELLELLRLAKVSLQGGYRLESLDDFARGDVLAEEILAVPKARRHVVSLLQKIYEFPALEEVAVPKGFAKELGMLAVDPTASVGLLWRLLVDPEAEVRQAAIDGLDALADDLFAEPEPGHTHEETTPAAETKAASGADSSGEMARLRKEAHAAQSESRRVQGKVASLKDQLKAARAEIVRLSGEAAAQARGSEKKAGELEQTRSRLAELQRKEGLLDATRLEKERNELASRVATLDERLRAATAERAQLAEARAQAERQLDEARARPTTEAPRAADAEVPEDAPTTWLLPRYTKEFYASLEGWDARIQRAAFKQAHLLAENHRHPSLRAIPLEGLPNHYRVRIATDVRLIYRRGDSDREIELLSLIDREDLDRYIRQAKTR